MDEDVAQFMAITGVEDERVARGFLEISGSDPMQAIQLFFESPELASNFTAANTNAQSSAPAQSSRSGRGYTGREDARGVITIDSDDEGDDVDMLGAENDDDNGVAAVARAAQEEDDAAMARRLQEEMYSPGAGGQEEVRAPIQRTTETLVGPDPSWGLEDDREAAVLEQLRRRRQPPSMAHYVWYLFSYYVLIHSRSTPKPLQPVRMG